MTRQRMFLDINCVDAARERMKHIYDLHDTVCVQFSGGKDSTAVLYLAKEIHEERGLGPVKVIFRDEEMVSPTVVRFVEEVANYDWVDMEWYCLGGDTEVITRHGVRRIEDLAGGTHEIMTDRGRWVEAPFYNFGRRPVQQVTVSRNGITKTIVATPDHRWFVKSRKMVNGIRNEARQERLTSELRPGDTLTGSWGWRHVKHPSPFGVAHGFTYGDGSRGDSGCHVTFHGHKDAALKPFFDGHITSSSAGARLDGMAQPRAISLPRFFKDLPDLGEAPQYLYGWLAGYFAADGCVTTTGKCVLSSANRKDLEFVQTICTNLGIFTFDIRSVHVGDFATANSEMWEITIAGEDLTAEFFIIEEHRARYLATVPDKKRSRRWWKVVSVEDGGEAETYCAVVPGTHSFTLGGHILTGNCLPTVQEIWVLGRRELVLLWDGVRAMQGRLVRPMPTRAICAEDFGLPLDQPIPKMIDYYTMQGKVGMTAFVMGVRANESMIRYRSCVQKLHENYIVRPYRLSKTVPLRFAKPIYDWTTNDVLKFITVEHGANYCEYYDLAEMTGSNARVGIPLHSVAIRRIGDLIATEPDFFDQLVWCFPEIDAQRRLWSEIDVESLVSNYANDGWDGVRACISDNMLGETLQLEAKAYAAAYRKKWANDPYSYPIDWLIRTLLLNEFSATAVNPVGPKTRAYAVRAASIQDDVEVYEA